MSLSMIFFVAPKFSFARYPDWPPFIFFLEKILLLYISNLFIYREIKGVKGCTF